MIGKGSLSDQTIGFMQTLTEVVSSVPRCVLIATLPASATEVASSAIGQQILTALENRIVRVGTSIKPVEDEEIFEGLESSYVSLKCKYRCKKCNTKCQ